MRSLYRDAEYYDYLDNLREESGMNTMLAAGRLAQEFPGLMMEEAKAVCMDWRSSHFKRRAS